MLLGQMLVPQAARRVLVGPSGTIMRRIDVVVRAARVTCHLSVWGQKDPSNVQARMNLPYSLLGKRIVNVVPFPSWLSTAMEP